jgi:hypothetical protein
MRNRELTNKLADTDPDIQLTELVTKLPYNKVIQEILKELIQGIERETRFEYHLNYGGKQILKAMKGGDPLGALVRGHLFVESKLIELIEDTLHNPNAIDLSRINFPTKLNLAVAMGLLPESERRGYTALNALRNRVAHNFETELVASDENTLLKSFSKELKTKTNNMLSLFQGRKLPIFRACVVSLCFDSLQRVLGNRNNHAFSLKLSDESFMQRLGKAVLETQPKTTPRYHKAYEVITRLIMSGMVQGAQSTAPARFP